MEFQCVKKLLRIFDYDVLFQLYLSFYDLYFFTDAVPVRDIITVIPPWPEGIQEEDPQCDPENYEDAMSLVATLRDQLREHKKELEALKKDKFNQAAELARVRKDLIKLKAQFKEISPAARKDITKADKKQIIWEFMSNLNFTPAQIRCYMNVHVDEESGEKKFWVKPNQKAPWGNA